jgi:primase-polymerase (primpol)-like protein
MDFNIENLEKNLPQEIKSMRRFLLWRYEQVKGRLTKVPYCSVTRKAATNRPGTWNTFSGALDIYKANAGHFNGVGIALGDGIAGIDLDHVIDAEGRLDPKAAEIVAEIPGYIERSPSGNGLHILVKGSLPAPGERGNSHIKFGIVSTPINDNSKPGIEFYDETSPRYFTVTGDVWENRDTLNSEDASPAIASVYWRIQKAHDEAKEAANASKAAEKAARRAKKAEERPAKKARKGASSFDYDNDDALLQHIRESKQGEKFSRLFDNGSCDGYPSPSEAVGALLVILAWWTQKDEARMDRLFQRSALYNPEKWNRPQNGETLGSIEIRNACETCTGEYDPHRSSPGHTERLTMPSDIDDRLPTIITQGRQLPALLREIGESLQADEKLFRHGGGLASVENGTVTHYTTEAMPVLISRWANYVDSNNRGVFPPATASKTVLYSVAGDDGIRLLKHVVNVPTLRKDGTIFDLPGYDAISGLFFYPTGEIPKIQPDPTRESANKAAAWLLDMLRDFPFENESDRTNYIGLLLTFVVREMCGCVPLALIDAPSAGTGKSLLAKIAAITATGRLPEFGILPNEEEEARKLFTSKLQESPPVLVFDNAEKAIKSSALAALITADVWQDRLLGRNRILHLPARSVLIITGNNIRLGGDIPRRCYRVRIDANAARPWTRGGFSHQLPDYAAENRGKIIAALLTMARAWLIAGRPEGGNTVLGSFETWCVITGGILEYAGLNGFLDNLQEMYRDTEDGDDDAGQWVDWMDAIHEHFGDKAFTVKMLAEAMSNYCTARVKDDAPYALGDIGASNDRAWLTRLGIALRGRKGQVFQLSKSSVKLCQGIADPRSGKKHYWLDEIG